MNHQQTTLTAKNISKKLGGKPILKDISLNLIQSEIIALLGNSGCGKTTLLRIIAGLETPDQGTIHLSEKNITTLPPEKRNIGLVFQDFALFPHMSVKKNILYGLHNLPKKQRNTRTQEILKTTSLTEHQNKYPHQLSGGQQQRVALARALAPSPSLVLLDEPFSNLDASLRENLRKTVREILKKSHTPAIIVTHDQADADTVADRIITMTNQT